MTVNGVAEPALTFGSPYYYGALVGGEALVTISDDAAIRLRTSANSFCDTPKYFEWRPGQKRVPDGDEGTTTGRRLREGSDSASGRHTLPKPVHATESNEYHPEPNAHQVSNQTRA